MLSPIKEESKDINSSSKDSFALNSGNLIRMTPSVDEKKNDKNE